MTDQPPRCTASLIPTYPPHVTYHCAQGADHYDANREPICHPDGSVDVEGWHRADSEAGPVIWCDDADGAAPHQDGPDPVEPDNPAATALAQHIADHSISAIQAAFRLLGMRIDFELHEITEGPK